MFTFEGVTLRPLEPTDIETMYPWHLDYELDIYSSWGRTCSRAFFQKRWEEKLLDPPDDLITFGIEFEDRLVGRVQVALIDYEHRRCYIGILLGDRSVWGRGVGKKAVRIALDYAFTVLNLEKACAEVYDFNTRSCRLFEAVGFLQEGVLRQHELHNGARRDMYVYGILKEEFYARNQTLYSVPR